MDKLNFVKDGMIRLPPGFRFQPTDEELLFQYLKRKVFSCPLPASIIPEINVYKYDPWDLPGDSDQERYFFSNKEAKYRNGNRTNRATGSGYWKATGSNKFLSSRRTQIVGMKKTLVFYRGKPPHVSRTDWIMHEYCLVSAGTTASIFQQTENTTQHSLIQMEDWVLCHIFLKKRSIENDKKIVSTSEDIRVRNVGVARPRFFNFMMEDGAYLGPISSSSSSASSSSSSSGSSGITAVSSSGFDHEESSGCNSFSSSCSSSEP